MVSRGGCRRQLPHASCCLRAPAGRRRPGCGVAAHSRGLQLGLDLTRSCPTSAAPWPAADLRGAAKGTLKLPCSDVTAACNVVAYAPAQQVAAAAAALLEGLRQLYMAGGTAADMAALTVSAQPAGLGAECLGLPWPQLVLGSNAPSAMLLP